LIVKLVLRWERGEFYSQTLRHIFAHYHGVEVGMYTGRGCFQPWHFDPSTKVGRYCSIAADVMVFNQNHPLNFKSTHPFFFNPVMGYCDRYLGKIIPLEIGNDVWLGHGAMIMPNVRRIGDGAVVAAGAVVNKDVPPYAIVCGNPGRIVRYRFSPEKIKELLASRWWEKSIAELRKERQDFTEPLEDDASWSAEPLVFSSER
jgi:virginiamycin A acetyltransferase